jgi:hypothetical protein
MVSYDSEKTDIGIKKLVLDNDVYSYAYLQDIWNFLPYSISCVVCKKIT